MKCSSKSWFFHFAIFFTWFKCSFKFILFTISKRALEMTFESHRPAPAQLSLWQASFSVSLACWPGCLPTCKVWRTQSKDQWNWVQWKQVRVTTSSAVSQILYPTYYLAAWPIPNISYGIKHHHGQQPTWLLSVVCKRTSRDQVTSTSHSR